MPAVLFQVTLPQLSMGTVAPRPIRCGGGKSASALPPPASTQATVSSLPSYNTGQPCLAPQAKNMEEGLLLLGNPRDLPSCLIRGQRTPQHCLPKPSCCGEGLDATGAGALTATLLPPPHPPSGSPWIPLAILTPSASHTDVIAVAFIGKQSPETKQGGCVASTEGTVCRHP